MKKTISKIEMVTELMEDQEATWSYSAAVALIDYLEDIETKHGDAIEFVPEKLREEYTEYQNMTEIHEEYPILKTIEDLEAVTHVIKFKGGFIISEV